MFNDNKELIHVSTSSVTKLLHLIVRIYHQYTMLIEFYLYNLRIKINFHTSVGLDIKWQTVYTNITSMYNTS